MELRTENILNDLLDRYEHSKLSMGGSERKIRVRFVMRRDLPEYYSIENYASARQLDENLDYFESLGWIVVHREDELVESIDLNPAYVQDISKRLERSLRSDRNAMLKGLLESYRLQGIDEYIEAVIKRLDAYQSVKSLTFEEMPDQELFLKALSSIMTLKEDVYERVYSARHLGNSKAFDKVRSKTIHVLREFYSDEDSDDDVLAQFHILKNPGVVMVKGHGRIIIGTSVLCIEDFSDGAALTSSDLEKIISIDISDSTVLTIENLTSFYECRQPDAFMIYLGGYHNSVRRSFLSRLYAQYPNKTYLHFGDIDAGGFYILEHLKAKTGIPFKPWKMGIDELNKYAEYALPLTKNDRARLQKLGRSTEYMPVIDYMLAKNIKLEQENIDLQA